MEKDFDRWNEIKKKTDGASRTLFFHEREVWLVRMGANIGNELDGKGYEFLRPVLIVRVFNRATFFAVGLTGQRKIGVHYYYLGKIGNHESTANLSQVRLTDSRRLVKKIGTVPHPLFEELKNRLRTELLP